MELFSQVSKLAKEIVQEESSQFKALIGESVAEDDAQKENDASVQGEAENVKQAEAHEGIPQAAEENSLNQDQRVEENTEKFAQNVDGDTQEVAELLASNMSREEAVQNENMEFSTGFDLNIEDINTDFNNEVFQDGQETAQHVQETAEAQNVAIPEAQNVEVPAAQNVPVIQNVQVFDDMNASNEPLQCSQLSADPVPLASGSLPSVEVQLMAQTGQNVNLSSSTIGYVAGASNFLVSDLPTPKTIPSTLL